MTSPRDAPVFSSTEDLAAVCLRLRRDIVSMIAKAASGHPGGSLSAVEIIVALYWKIMRHKPTDPTWPDRDRFILSKGHGCAALYAVLARAGFADEHCLDLFCQEGGILGGHPDIQTLPGIEATTGALGHGILFASGIALAGTGAGGRGINCRY